MGGSQSNANGLYIPYISDIFSPPKDPVSYPIPQTIDNNPIAPWTTINTFSQVKQVIMNTLSTDIPIGSFIFLFTNGMLYYSTSLTPLSLIYIPTGVNVDYVTQISNGVYLIIQKDGNGLIYITSNLITPVWKQIQGPLNVAAIVQPLTNYKFAYVNKSGKIYTTTLAASVLSTSTTASWAASTAAAISLLNSLSVTVDRRNSHFIVDKTNVLNMCASSATGIVSPVFPTNVTNKIVQLVDVNTSTSSPTPGKPEMMVVTTNGTIMTAAKSGLKGQTLTTISTVSNISGVSGLFYFPTYGYIAAFTAGNIAVLPNTTSGSISLFGKMNNSSFPRFNNKLFILILILVVLYLFVLKK